MLDAVLDKAADAGMEGTVIGMSHRGRLNVLANTVGKSYGEIFGEFEGNLDPTLTQGSGDVKYHLGAVQHGMARSGKEVRVEVASNPSHLEAVNPVVEGIARARQDQLDRGEEAPVLPILIHGDAAFAGQGGGRDLNLSQLRGYRTGGTITSWSTTSRVHHQPDYGRSSTYATDVAKMIQAPIFHVNGDDPEACVRVARLAFDFRQAFKKDVVIDMCGTGAWPQRGRRAVVHPAADVRADQEPPAGPQALHRGAGQPGRPVDRGRRAVAGGVPPAPPAGLRRHPRRRRARSPRSSWSGRPRWPPTRRSTRPSTAPPSTSSWSS